MLKQILVGIVSGSLVLCSGVLFANTDKQKLEETRKENRAEEKKMHVEHEQKEKELHQDNLKKEKELREENKKEEKDMQNGNKQQNGAKQDKKS